MRRFCGSIKRRSWERDDYKKKEGSTKAILLEKDEERERRFGGLWRREGILLIEQKDT